MPLSVGSRRVSARYKRLRTEIWTYAALSAVIVIIVPRREHFLKGCDILREDHLASTRQWTDVRTEKVSTLEVIKLQHERVRIA